MTSTHTPRHMSRWVKGHGEPESWAMQFGLSPAAVIVLRLGLTADEVTHANVKTVS